MRHAARTTANAGSCFIEVRVGLASWAENDYVVLLPKRLLLSLKDFAEDMPMKHDKVHAWTFESLSALAVNKKWSHVKVSVFCFKRREERRRDPDEDQTLARPFGLASLSFESPSCPIPKPLSYLDATPSVKRSLNGSHHTDMDTFTGTDASQLLRSKRVLGERPHPPVPSRRNKPVLVRAAHVYMCACACARVRVCVCVCVCSLLLQS